MEGHPVRIETQNISDSGGGGGYRLFAGEEMSDKVTKEKMLGLLADLERISRISWSPETLNILYAIRSLIEHGPEVSRECIEYLTKIEKRTRDIIEWLEEPWDDPNAVIDEMTIRLKRLLQDTMGRR